jgi:hypothetical protein
VQCGPSSEENIPSPPRNWTQVAFSGVSHFATFGYILQGPDILKQCNGRAEKIWLWRYVLPASQELHCACVWCLPSRQQWVLVRLKDCAVTLIYLHCKCSSPLHYNDICPPPLQQPMSRGPLPQIGLLFMMNVCGESFPPRPSPLLYYLQRYWRMMMDCERWKRLTC